MGLLFVREKKHKMSKEEYIVPKRGNSNNFNNKLKILRDPVDEAVRQENQFKIQRVQLTTIRSLRKEINIVYNDYKASVARSTNKFKDGFSVEQVRALGYLLGLLKEFVASMTLEMKVSELLEKMEQIEASTGNEFKLTKAKKLLKDQSPEEPEEEPEIESLPE